MDKLTAPYIELYKNAIRDEYGLPLTQRITYHELKKVFVFYRGEHKSITLKEAQELANKKYSTTILTPDSSPIMKFFKENKPSKGEFVWKEDKTETPEEVIANRPFKGYHGRIASIDDIPTPIVKVSKEEIQRQLEEGPGKFDYEQKLIRSEKEMEEREVWSMYDVIMVDKEELKTVIDTSVIAKTKMHAKGKAGVYDKLEKAIYDESKFVIKVAHITDIRPVEEDNE